MALLDIFKRKKPEKKKEKPKAKVVEVKPLQASTKQERGAKLKMKPQLHRQAKSEKPVVGKKAVAKKKPVLKEGKKSGGRAYQILKTPHVTEKATSLISKNQYVFKVWPRANKVEVRKAVEDVFGVDVISVKIINVIEKKRRLGRIEGFKSGYKKAIVGLKRGQKIEISSR